MTRRNSTTLLQIARKSGAALFPWPARTAVSLHCHTKHSQEILDFIPHYAAQIPLVAPLFKREQAKYQRRFGHPINFANTWWTPPVSPAEVWASEIRQIEDGLQLRGLVSITDHDCIGAGRALQVLDLKEMPPISLEWTVPFEGGYFHMGVHNLPADQASEISELLLGYTRAPQIAGLTALLAMLNSVPEVLLVLNHPLWDIEMIGDGNHRSVLGSFLEKHGEWIHALEANGFRSWKENEEVIRMGNDLGFPVVSGGDRHGCQPNTIINLTRAGSFVEFVNEVREGHSKILVMPEYNAAMFARIIQGAAEILRDYPQASDDSRKWHDRVFVRDEFGIVKSLTQKWTRGVPLWVKMAVGVTCFLGNNRLQPAWRAAIPGEEVRL